MSDYLRFLQLFIERFVQFIDRLAQHQPEEQGGCQTGVQHLLHLKSKSKILRPIEIMGFFYEFFCQIQGNNLL